MKKLMIAAAVAAVAGVSLAANCERVDPVTPTPSYDGANVYQLQMQLRSTWGAPCGSEGVTIDASLCGRETATTGTVSVVRIPASFVINAWIYSCTNDCTSLALGSLVAWEQNRAEPFVSPKITWNVLNIMGISADQAEASFDFVGKIADYSNGASANPLAATWNIKCAGQGTFGKNEKGPKYMFFSGYCAGEVSASYYIQGKLCEASKVVTCGGSLVTCPGEVQPTAVFGRWALRYNTEASVQYFEHGTLNVPAYVK